jgi:hypothetical protein
LALCLHHFKAITVANPELNLLWPAQAHTKCPNRYFRVILTLCYEESLVLIFSHKPVQQIWLSTDMLINSFLKWSHKVFKSSFIICLISNTKEQILFLLKLIERLQLMYWKGLFISSEGSPADLKLRKSLQSYIILCHIVFLCQIFVISFNEWRSVVFYICRVLFLASAVFPPVTQCVLQCYLKSILPIYIRNIISYDCTLFQRIMTYLK